MLLLFALAVVVGALAWIGLSRWPLHRSQACHFACPLSAEPVDCDMVQDIRTGQYKAVRSCSAFPEGEVRCALDCARLMNLGFRLPPAGHA
jgi:hypothetical protein